MPLPEPNEGETHDEFVDRCMANPTMNEEHPDNDQRYAICEGIWEDDKKSIVPAVERRFTAHKRAPVRVETRADGSKRIVGLAAVYYDGTKETEYELWPGVRERIQPGAFARILKEKPDVRALFNHDPNHILGRTAKKTLILRSTDDGLEYEIDPPDTQMARDVMALLERGDIDGSSFSFRIKEETTINEEKDVIYELADFAQLYDVGPVTFPAYTATTADLRALEIGRERPAVASPAAPKRQISEADARLAARAKKCIKK